jgi:hypothetical protein
MRLLKISVIALILAIIVYLVTSWLKNRETFLTPLPEEGIKVIQLSPTK